MGNDGGTIARRSDLVHTKQQTAKTSLDIDPRSQARNTFASCALSRLPLKQPVVADCLGNLYRKEKVVEFLLKKQELAASREHANGMASASGSGSGKEVKEIGIAGHLRGLKDVKALNMTQASPSKSQAADSNLDSTTFICPLTSKVMNGSTGRFIYIRTCGCVMSESGLRAVAGNQNLKKDPSSEPVEDPSTIPCPVCSAPFNSLSLSKPSSGSLSSPSPNPSATSETIPPLFAIPSDLIPIYPPTKELDWLKSKMEMERELEKQKKKEKKEKKSKGEKKAEGKEDEVSNSNSSDKKSSDKKRSAAEASLDPIPSHSKIQKQAAPQGPQTAAQRLALEAKQRTEEKKKTSEALRSLYGEDEFGNKKVGKQQESWMTRGTFTRYA